MVSVSRSRTASRKTSLVEAERALQGTRRRQRRSGRGDCPGRRSAKSSTASFARSIRSGFTSSVSMLLEQSTAMQHVETAAGFLAPLIAPMRAAPGAMKMSATEADQQHALEQPAVRWRRSRSRPGTRCSAAKKMHRLPSAAVRAHFEEDHGEDGQRADPEARPARRTRNQGAPRVLSWHPPPARVGQENLEAKKEQDPQIEHLREILAHVLEALHPDLAGLELVDLLVNMV